MSGPDKSSSIHTTFSSVRESYIHTPHHHTGTLPSPTPDTTSPFFLVICSLSPAPETLNTSSPNFIMLGQKSYLIMILHNKELKDLKTSALISCPTNCLLLFCCSYVCMYLWGDLNYLLVYEYFLLQMCQISCSSTIPKRIVIFLKIIKSIILLWRFLI